MPSPGKCLPINGLQLVSLNSCAETSRSLLVTKAYEERKQPQAGNKFLPVILY
jgi:hypothetical protein